MEEFVKEVLYAFPLLKTVEKDYAEHIENKAVLSYKSNLSTEKLAEYIVGEILEKQRLIWLKSAVNGVLDRLNQTEKTMVALRYFGQTKKKKLQNGTPFGEWSERRYFREQEKLGKKLNAMMTAAGITCEVFSLFFAPTQLFTSVHKYTKKRSGKLSEREKEWLYQEKSSDS